LFWRFSEYVEPKVPILGHLPSPRVTSALFHNATVLARRKHLTQITGPCSSAEAEYVILFRLALCVLFVFCVVTGCRALLRQSLHGCCFHARRTGHLLFHKPDFLVMFCRPIPNQSFRSMTPAPAHFLMAGSLRTTTVIGVRIRLNDEIASFVLTYALSSVCSFSRGLRLLVF